MRLRPGRRHMLQAVLLMLWTSGLLWLVAHHWLVRPGDYGPQPSPLEPWCLRAHGLAALGTTGFIGLLWAVHIEPGWALRRRRWSGGLVFASALLLIASGYLLYYVGDEATRATLSLAHWSLGLAALPLFLLHRVAPRRRRRR
ncbi:hypothetical protein [Sphingomonas morindae]|uniref:DUF4405 domain-containing protein n=1 Tax=Sphingomonas morindae TaxID=1541170 RepID=A0ABY4XD26_9SPHN|nr:hypothetical protein [Sphingomonas morindae]USI74808.1 hypothetical protein LHA26_18855 [Sphingomonas morindae]